MAKTKKKNKKTKKKAKKLGVVAKPPKPPRNSQGQLTSGWGRGSKQVKKKLKAKKKKLARRADGTLLPGQASLNSQGFKVGSSRSDELAAAFRRVEEKQDKSFLDMCVEKAYEDTAMAIALLRKVHPDLKAIEMLTGSADSIPDEEAAEWREEMNKRFKG